MNTKQMPKLKRSLGLGLITLYGLGNILGAGIYVLVGKVAGLAGMHAPVAFVLAALVAAPTAFTYGELCARHPVSAGEAVYVQKAFGIRALAMIVGLLIAFAGMVSAATLVRGFVGYFQIFLPWPDAVVIGAVVISLGLIAAWGITESVRLAGALTLLEAAGLVLIIVVAGDGLAKVPTHVPDLMPPMSWLPWTGIFAGTFLAFFAFIGFEDMVNVAEEVQRPERNIPRGILLALGISTTLYLLVVLAAILTVAPERLADSEAPLALIYEQATGRPPTLISAIGLCAVVNGALIQIIMAARIFYGMSVNGWLPGALSRVHPITKTPLIATVLVCGLVLAFALWFPLIQLAGATSLLVLSVFSLVNLALIRLKATTPAPKGVRPVPLWVPVAGLMASTGILLAQLLRWV